MEIFLFNLTDIITLTSPKNNLFTFFSPKSKLFIILERKKLLIYLYFFHNLLETVVMSRNQTQFSFNFFL